MGWIDAAMGGAGLLYGELTRERSKRDQKIANEQTAELNYQYGEKAANNADARARAIYTDFNSPEAKVKQLQEAGLSTAMMYSGGGGGGGSAAATTASQGSGAGGQQGKTPESAMQGAQLGLMLAQIRSLNADAENKEVEAKNKKRDWKFSNEEIEYLLSGDTGRTGTRYEIEKGINWEKQNTQGRAETREAENKTDLEIRKAIEKDENGDPLYMQEFKAGLNKLVEEYNLTKEQTAKLVEDVKILRDMQEQGGQEWNIKREQMVNELWKAGISAGGAIIGDLMKLLTPAKAMKAIKK